MQKNSRTKARIGPLFNTSTNEYTESSTEMAELLQQQYESVFSKPSASQNPVTDLPDAIMDEIVITVEDLISAIDKTNQNSAAGPDGLSAILLKKCKLTVAKPFVLLYNNLLRLGVTPMALKTSHIAPIYKGGDQGLPKN